MHKQNSNCVQLAHTQKKKVTGWEGIPPAQIISLPACLAQMSVPNQLCLQVTGRMRAIQTRPHDSSVAAKSDIIMWLHFFHRLFVQPCINALHSLVSMLLRDTFSVICNLVDDEPATDLYIYT